MKHQIHLHVELLPKTPDALSVRVVSQMPSVAPALPFTAGNGVEIRASESRPFLTLSGDGTHLVLGLRGGNCPLQLENVAVIATGAGDVRQAARLTREAVSELRHSLNARVPQ